MPTCEGQYTEVAGATTTTGPTHRTFFQLPMDFVFGLPCAKDRDEVWQGVMTVVDHATKWKTFVAMHEGITTVEAADLFRPFGVPQEIISDGDPRFKSSFWQQLFVYLGTHLLHSTAHHPRTDGESKRAHRVIE